MATPQDMLREVAALNRRRTRDGISPIEYQRWLDLRQKLSVAFPAYPPLKSRTTTWIRVEFRDEDALLDSMMFNIRPIGIFIMTPFAAEVGAKLGLVVFVQSTGEQLRARVEVVSNNVGPDFSTALLGMGLRFTERVSDLRSALEKIHQLRSV